MNDLDKKLRQAMFELGDMHTHLQDVQQAIANKQQEIAAIRSAMAMASKEASRGAAPAHPPAPPSGDTPANGASSSGATPSPS